MTVPSATPDRLRVRDLAIAWSLYLGLAVVVSYPLIRTLGSSLPGSLTDPLQHLWVMRWYRTCLAEWRSPLICPELQYPVGAPLGNFSPLHMQFLIFLPLSLILGNDILSFNLVWLLAMSTTGLATFLLAWQALRDKPIAAFCGMLAMLSTPMLMHARAHLELISLGGFPLFLVGWMRFVDRPGRRRLFAASGLYLVVAMCAAYYAVLATIPAILYVAWARFPPSPCPTGGPNDPSPSPLPWLLAFAAIVLPPMALLFSSQLWAVSRGYSTERPLSEFLAYGSAPWAFVTPTPYHRLSRLGPVNLYAEAGYSRSMLERASYLGLVPIALIVVAGLGRATFCRRGYFWIALAVLILMAWGGQTTIAGRTLTLPSGWLHAHVSALRAIRVPARYNLLAAVVASVIAGAGLKHVMGRVSRKCLRVSIPLGVGVLAAFDLLMTRPFPALKVPEMPSCYREILARDPGATFLEVPQFPSTGSVLSSMSGYWQSIHRGRTTAGYSGNGNSRLDDRMVWNSPFRYSLFEEPDYLADPDDCRVSLFAGVSFVDHAWLFLHANHVRYLVVHDWPGYAEGYPEKLARMKPLLDASKVYDDGRTIVYDRDRMATPSRPVILSADGWRPSSRGRRFRSVDRVATLIVFNPSAEIPVTFSVKAQAGRADRRVRLTRGGRELSRWDVPSGDSGSSHREANVDLPRGLVELSLEIDADGEPLDVSELRVSAARPLLAGRASACHIRDCR